MVGNRRLNALPLCLLLFLGSCQSEVVVRTWKSHTLYTMDSKIQTVAFGSLWEDEIPCLALAAADGRCIVLWEQEGTWRHRELHQAPGGLTAAAIGDVDPETPGPDLIVGTGGGQILRIFVTREGDVLVKMIFQADAPIGDLSVCDLDPNKPGEEILLLTESGRATVVNPPQEGSSKGYTFSVVMQDTARLRNVSVGPFGPQNQTAAILVGSSGNVNRIYCVGDTWRVAELYKNPEPLARIAAGDVDPTSETPELILVDDKGLITLLRQRSGRFAPEAVYKEAKALRGVVVGEFVPEIPGEEFVVFGYGKEVALFSRKGTSYERKVLFEDTDRGHWLIKAQIRAQTPEFELVAVGYSGKVTLISKE
ncbi:MAG: hypothetical protein KJ645_12370 [Planctomycetes bacterium]|nr:hypothetical protein [Planctomycetota bacterium]